MKSNFVANGGNGKFIDSFHERNHNRFSKKNSLNFVISICNYSFLGNFLMTFVVTALEVKHLFHLVIIYGYQVFPYQFIINLHGCSAPIIAVILRFMRRYCSVKGNTKVCCHNSRRDTHRFKKYLVLFRPKLISNVALEPPYLTIYIFLLINAWNIRGTTRKPPLKMDGTHRKWWRRTSLTGHP